MAKHSIVICICGMTGSGKSTLAKRLARKYALKYYSGGDALKDLAMEQGYNPREEGWWESEEGIRFLEKRSKNLEFDKAVDQKLLEVAKKGNVILDSWTMPWLLEKGFKVWLEASREKRVERVSGRDNMSVKEALKALKKKEERTKKIYRRLYGFKLGEDFDPFHFILDTKHLNKEEAFHVLCQVIENFPLKNSM